MNQARLGDLTETVSTWRPSSKPEEFFDYIDLSAVDNEAKCVRATSGVLGSEAPSRARQIVLSGDVLVSTVRPNLNAVAVVDPHFSGATASTGFTVLRPTRQMLDSQYLFHWVRTPAFIGSMVQQATGASYPAVSDRIVKNSFIPAPALTVQRRIAAILDQVDALRAKRRQVLDHLEALTQAIFHSMFGDPDASPHQVQLSEVAQLTCGRNLVADDAKAITPYRVLKISAVTSGHYRHVESKPLPPGYVPPPNHLVQAGDLLMSRANTEELVGAAALVGHTPANLALPDKIWRFDWRDPNSVPLYYHALFRSPSIRRTISRLASGTGGSMKNVSKAKLLAMRIPHVGIKDQHQFADRAEQVAHQRQMTEKAAGGTDELFASLQSRAFRGEL